MSAADARQQPPPRTGGFVRFCDESIMAPKAHGTSDVPVQTGLRWGVDRRKADRICNFNRDGAEYPGYWRAETRFIAEEVSDEAEPSSTVFYDSVTGKPLFVAPVGRTMREARRHGLETGASTLPCANRATLTRAHSAPSVCS